MLPYGIPRVPETETPDLADIALFGFKSSRSRVEKHGHIKNSFRSTENKARVRRIWKKKIRRHNKNVCRHELFLL